MARADEAGAADVEAAADRAPVASRWWHGSLGALLLAAFVVQIVLLVAGGADANSGQAEDAGLGVRLVRFFSYFTIQSNLLTLAALWTLAIRPHRDGRGWRVLRLDSLLGIVITGLVFDLILAKQVSLTGLALWLTIVFHYISPWGTLLGWLLFGPRPRVDWSTVAWAFVWPVLWVAYTFVHGAVSGWYPYPFLDVDALGFATSFRNTLLVVLVAFVLALVIKALDRLPAIRR